MVGLLAVVGYVLVNAAVISIAGRRRCSSWRDWWRS
jgi:hypothetical protein